MRPFQEIDAVKSIKSTPLDKLVLVESENSSSKICASVAALANTSGGSVFIGINSKLKIRGVNPSCLDQLSLLLKSNISPAVRCDFKLLKDRHYFIVQIDVLKANQVLSFKDDDESWKRALILEESVMFSNEVLDVFLKLKITGFSVSNFQYNQSEHILALIRESKGLSITQLVSKSRLKRFEVINELAAMLLDSRIKILSVNGIIHYINC